MFCCLSGCSDDPSRLPDDSLGQAGRSMDHQVGHMDERNRSNARSTTAAARYLIAPNGTSPAGDPTEPDSGVAQVKAA